MSERLMGSPGGFTDVEVKLVDSVLESIRRDRRLAQEPLDRGWHGASHVGIRGDFEDTAWWLDDGNITGEHRFCMSGCMFASGGGAAVLSILTWE